MREEVRDFTPDEAVVFGESLEAQGDTDNAERLYRSVLVVDPNHFHAMCKLGTLLTGKKEYYEGLYRLNRAVKMDPKNDIALSNRAMVMSVLGHHEEAEPDFVLALHFDPHNYITLANYGNTLEHLERFEEALKMFDRSLAIKPDEPVTQHNRGVALFRLGRLDEAIAACDKTLELDPDYHQARYNRGLSKLFNGDLKGGFEDAEGALLDPSIRKPLFGPFKKPQWDGSIFEGQTLLLTGEQGIGDTIHFMRYVPHVIDKGGKVIIAIHEMARSLYDPPAGVKILKHGETAPPFDMHCPLMSLPHRLDMADPPAPPLPTFWYALGDIDRWKERINAGECFNVGLVFSGNPGHKHDKDRSIPAEKFAKLVKTPGCRFFSLQHELRPDDAKALADMPEVDNLGAEIKSFRDTAAILRSIDLLITVDTSVAHLAGSLAIDTWVLLPAFGTDWRWQRYRTDSPWYPTMKLVRQSKRGDWDFVLNRVAKELATLVAERQAA